MNMTLEVHFMNEMPEDLIQHFPDYKNRPYVMKAQRGLHSTHYVIYTDNPFIRMNPLKYVVRKNR